MPLVCQWVFEVYGVFLPGDGSGFGDVGAEGGEEFVVYLVFFAERPFFFGVVF